MTRTTRTRRTRTVLGSLLAGAALTVAATAGTTLATATPATASPNGTGVTDTPTGDMFAFHRGCAYILSTGTIGGIDAQGFSNAWVLRVDPRNPPGVDPGADLVPGCSFSGQVTSARAAGGPPHVTRFVGDSGNLASQTRPVADDVDRKIRPESITVEICRAGDCSGPLNGPA